MLVINPEECIDCGVCVPECPVDAIKAESDGDDLMIWIERGHRLSKIWPQITVNKPAPIDADDYKDEKGKFEKYIGD